MIIPENNTELQIFIQLMLSGYLFFNGIIGLVNRKNTELTFFHYSGISLAIYFFSPAFQFNQYISEFSLLLTWSFLLIFIKDQSPNPLSSVERLYGFLIPVVWLLVSITYANHPVPFQTVYFFQFILTTSAGIYESNRLRKLTFLTERKIQFYLMWIHFGLLSLVAIRLILPFLISDITIYMTSFHWVLFAYIVGIAAFNNYSIRASSPESFELKIEETANQEDLTKRKLELVLNEEQAFLIPDLTIQELAARMHMRASELSEFFNTKLGMNFNDIVNNHRIEEVKRLITDPETDPKATIMELAYQSGFNSKASFNRIFKQRTGSTPKEYRKAALPK